MPIDEHLAFDTTSVELRLHWLTLRYGIEVRLLIADLRARARECNRPPRQPTSSRPPGHTLPTSPSDLAAPDAHRRATPRFPLLLRLSKGRAKPQLPPAVAPSFPPFPSG